MQNKHNINDKQNETDFSVKNNLPKNFPVNATKGAQVLALVFVIGAAVFTNGDQTAIAANASVQPHSGILISTPPPPPPPTHNLKARKGAYYAGKGHSRANTFADFYKQRQIELLSALDNVLSQKAQDTLSEFAAVKKAEVNFQTSLGNRQGQLGINLIGAFAERQNNAFGWQVRVYGAQQDGKGFNAGVFYRHITDNVLIGANAFVDYENHKLGNFYRYSIGGKAQNRYGSFAANYYVPITKEKRKDGGVIFSRKGYDAKLRLNIPNAKFLKAAIDYYNFGDEHGAESDDGFRYGAEAHLIPGLRIALLYDNGEKELGGEVSYIHTIGEVQQAQTANEQWTPDLFAAVSREHSQRIVSVSVVNASLPPPMASSPPPVFGAFDYRGTVGFTATIGAISVVAGYFSNTATATIFNALSPELMTASNGTLIWQPTRRSAKTLSVAVSDLPPSQTATLLITTAIALAESGRLASVLFTVGYPGLEGFVTTETQAKYLLTLPPAMAVIRPLTLTITGNFRGAGSRELIIRSSRQSGVNVGSFTNFQNRVRAYTIIITEGSEEYQSTLYAQADIPFVDMPGFSPPSFPQMAELALTKNARNAIPIPPHFAFLRQKGFAAKPPPLIF